MDEDWLLLIIVLSYPHQTNSLLTPHPTKHPRTNYFFNETKNSNTICTIAAHSGAHRKTNETYRGGARWGIPSPHCLRVM